MTLLEVAEKLVKVLHEDDDILSQDNLFEAQDLSIAIRDTIKKMVEKAKSKKD